MQIKIIKLLNIRDAHILNAQYVYKQNENINSEWCTFSPKTQNALKIAHNKISKLFIIQDAHWDAQ